MIFRTIYQKIREYDILDKRKTVTALKAGEDRAILLGLSMIFFSVMMYFVLGITMVRSYTDRYDYSVAIKMYVKILLYMQKSLNSSKLNDEKEICFSNQEIQFRFVTIMILDM